MHSSERLVIEFCGGFSTPSSGRTPFPLSGSAPVLIDSHHPSAIVGMFISFDSNPSNFFAFNQTASGQQYGLLDPFGGISGTGEVRLPCLITFGPIVLFWLTHLPARQFCFRVDIASLGVSGLTNGSVATLQYVSSTRGALPLQSKASQVNDCTEKY